MQTVAAQAFLAEWVPTISLSFVVSSSNWFTEAGPQQTAVLVYFDFSHVVGILAM